MNIISKLISDYRLSKRLSRYRKNKSTMKYYEIETTTGLFGNFSYRNGYDYVVMARNHREAITRLKKRGCALQLNCDSNGTTENWARFKVKEVGKPENHRYIYYF